MTGVKHLLVILLLCMGLYVGVCGASGDTEQGVTWWNLQFTRMIPINLSSAMGDDYPLLINVTHAADMQNDFGDIRFVTCDGTTEIPYYISYYDEEDYALIYVKIPANESWIAMYYGNPGVETTSSGENTFILFDDFETTLNTTKWDTSGIATAYTTDGSLYTKGAENTWANYNSAAIADIPDISGAFVAETNLTYWHNENQEMTIGYFYLKTKNAQIFGGLNDAWASIAANPSFDSTIGATGYNSGKSTRWVDGVMDMKIVRHENGTVNIYENGALRQSLVFTERVTDVRLVSNRYQSYSTHTLYWSHVIVRPLIDSEPTITWGYVESAGNPPASFTASPTYEAAGKPIQFNDTTPDNVWITWSWDFGDGVGTSTNQNPVYTYTAPGVYNVTLNASNEVGYDEITVQNCMNITNAIPVAGFTKNATTIRVNNAVAFTDTSSGFVTNWLWNFGDGTTSVLQNPTHVYSAVGTYTVSLRVWNDAINVNDSYYSELVSSNCLDVEDYPPVANFEASVTHPDIGQIIAFTDLSTGVVNEWWWEFGDGGTSTLQNPTHVYTSAGMYTVKLTVRNTGGESTSERIRYILVAYSSPIADFSSNVTTVVKDNVVQFTDRSSGIVEQYLWKFGDGNTSTLQNPVHAYGAVGVYTVTLTVSNAIEQNTVTKTNFIFVVSNPPVVSFTYEQIDNCKIAFMGAAITSDDNPVVEWVWDFGDGVTTTTQNPVYRYTISNDVQEKSYAVTLSARNDGGWGHHTMVIVVDNAMYGHHDGGTINYLWLPYADRYLSQFITLDGVDGHVEIDSVNMIATCIEWLQENTASFGVLITALAIVLVITIKTQSIFALWLSLSLIVSDIYAGWCPEEAKLLLIVILALALAGIILKPIIRKI